MTLIHGFGAQAALVVVILVLVAAVGLAATRRMPGPVFMWAPVVAFLLLALTGLAGIVTLAIDGPPSDGLHILYGVLAIAGLPITLVVSNGQEGRRRALAWIVGSVAVALLVMRLFQTGG